MFDWTLNEKENDVVVEFMVYFEVDSRVFEGCLAEVGCCWVFLGSDGVRCEYIMEWRQ